MNLFGTFFDGIRAFGRGGVLKVDEVLINDMPINAETVVDYEAMKKAIGLVRPAMKVNLTVHNHANPYAGEHAFKLEAGQMGEGVCMRFTRAKDGAPVLEVTHG